jgi:hypothetical protein
MATFTSLVSGGRPGAAIDLTCPKCASTDARSLSLIYREGLSITQAHSTETGTAFSGGGMAVGSSSTVTHARSQTVLSKEAAPPAKKSFVVWCIGIVIFGFMVLGSLGSFGMSTIVFAGLTGGCVLMAKRAREFNTTQHPALMAHWEKSFMCGRCGVVFAA